MKIKMKLIKYIWIWGIIFLAGLGICFICVDVTTAYGDFKRQSERIRSAYVDRQKEIIRQEVMRAVDLIRHHRSQRETLTKKKIKARTYEAYAVASHIHQQYQYTENKTRMQQLVLDALRAIRFDNGNGYYFATRFDGVELLFADRPQMEGLNLLNTQDTKGHYIIKDMIEIATREGEGFYAYYWTKPDTHGNDFKKISFIKRFKPLNCFIGTGLYVDDTEEQINTEVLSDISRIRFGKEGYIFVNRFNGDALVSNGKHFSGTRKLWEEFNDDPGKMKQIFEKEHQAALKPQGDYIRYSHLKLSRSTQESPKISFIFGLPELEWLVGAGVYIDDVENHIAFLQKELNNQIEEKVFYFILTGIVMTGLFSLFYSRLSQRLKRDTEFFLSFLNGAVNSNKQIDRNQVRFYEFDQIAESTNTMIKKRQLSEETLRENQKRLQSILQTNPNPVVVYDTQGFPQFINDSFSNLFGWTFEEVKDRTIPFVPEDQKEITLAKIKEIYQSEEPLQFLTKRLTKSKKLLIVNISAALYKDAKGEKKGMVVNLTDITDQVKLEEELNQAKKMEAIGRLAGGVAHDFNNMLSIILGNTEIMFEDLDAASPVVSNLKEIRKAAERSADLTRQLLAFARKQTISPRIIDLNSLIDGMTQMLRRLIGENIELSWHPKTALWPVKIDPSQINQLLANLCVNARDSIRDVGRVVIETDNVHFDEMYCRTHPGFKSGDYVLIRVSDNGCGMDKETLDNLFEPFFTTKNLGEGTGLGLAIIYGIVEQNNGFINVYSQPEQGTTFKIYIPRNTEISAIETRQYERKDLQKGHETILLVEDETVILQMTKLMLERLGYKVLATSNPKEAIRISNQSREEIHLLMSDVVMPLMNGRKLAEIILKSFPNMKCLYMSGYSANIVAPKGVLDTGINFIGKPFSKQRLAVKLREILDEKSS